MRRSTPKPSKPKRGAREILAKCIIEMVQRGERDKQLFSEAAVTYLAENHKG
jgi:hypothetical protein